MESLGGTICSAKLAISDRLRWPARVIGLLFWEATGFEEKVAEGGSYGTRELDGIS